MAKRLIENNYIRIPLILAVYAYVIHYIINKFYYLKDNYFKFWAHWF
jgi:hypothetical protein